MHDNAHIHGYRTRTGNEESRLLSRYNATCNETEILEGECC